MVNILFCGNRKIFDGVLTCALSILRRTQSPQPFCFNIFTMDISHLNPDYVPITNSQVKCLLDVVRSYNPDNQVKLFDVTDIYKRELANSPNETTSYSPYTLVRLFADLIDEIPDKLLYLDADIMFNRDIHLLYDIDISDYEYAAAPDHYGKYLINPHYINAGVILFNIAKCRQSGLLEKAREVVRTKKMLFPDQSAIVKSTTKRMILKQRFNDQKFLHKHTIVRHFSKRLFYLPYPHTDNVKQWQVDKVHKVFKYHQFDDIFDEYLKIKKEYTQNTQSTEENE